MKKLRKINLILTGGLGNQLFQIQFLKNLRDTQNYEISIDINLGKPRGKHGIPDAFEFGIPCRVKSEKYSKLASKSIGYLLRSSYKPNRFEKKPWMKFIIKSAVSFVLSLHFKEITSAISPGNLGYDPNFITQGKNVTTMGYFQSVKYAPTSDNFPLLDSPPTSNSIRNFQDLSKMENPIIVHVRRGDYASENSFGLLGQKYYEEAIKRIKTITNLQHIWLFSDEIQTAVELIPKQFRNKVRIIGEIDDLPSHTLEVMRLGKGYVIANSTFSWWAAHSAYDRSAPVVAPSEWFKSMEAPADIIPKSWLKISPDFL